MSVNQPIINKGSAESGCVNLVGCGCLAIVAVFAFVMLSLSGGFGSGFWLVALIVGVVVIAIVASRKSKKTGSPSTVYNTPVATATLGIGPTPDSQTESEFVKSPLCHHTFPKSRIDGEQPLECSCGYRIPPADWRELDQVTVGIRDLEARRVTIMNRMMLAQGAAERSGSSSKVTGEAAKTVAKPKVAKPRRAISTQQWLVIGASILIFVAGMVFVSTNLNRLPQWAFQLITGGIAVVAGLGSIYMRKISSLLASFFTAFSASMQLAFMAILGDQLNASFEWNTAPAWWWLISLGVIATISGALAKVTKIFGWKALALAATTSTALVLELGVLMNQFDASAASVHIVILSVTAVATLWLTKTLRAIPAIDEKDDALKAYAKDLGQREDASLRWFGVVAAAAQLTVGLGLFLSQYILVATTPLQPLPLLALALVWVGIAATATRWSGQLRQNGEQLTEFESISRFVAHISVGLAAVSAGLVIGEMWIALVVALVGLLAINTLSGLYSPIRPSAYTSLAYYGAASVAWGLWTSSLPEFGEKAEVIPVFIAGASLALVASEVRYRIDKFAWITGAAYSGALVWFTLLNGQRFEDYEGWAFSALTLVLMLLSSLPLAFRALVTKRVEGKTPVGFEWLGLGVASTVAGLQLGLLGTAADSFNILQLFPMVTLLGVYSIAALGIGAFTRVGREHKWLLQGHSYMSQVLLLVLILASAEAGIEEQYWIYAALLTALAVLNYCYGWLQRQTLGLQIGFGYLIAALIPLQKLGDNADIVWVALVTIVAITAAAFGHERVLKRLTDTRPMLVQASMLIGLSVGLSFVLGVQWAAWNNSTIVQQLIVQALLWLIALGISGWNWLATRASKSISMSVWWVSIIYVVFAGAISTLGNNDGNPQQTAWQWLLSSLAIGLTLAGNFRSKPWIWLIPLAIVANLGAGWFAGWLTTWEFKLPMIPEPYTVWMAIALITTTLVVGGVMKGWRNRLLLDIPVLAIAMGSFLFAIAQSGVQSNETLIRGILSLAVISGFAYWRSGRELPQAWLGVGYLAGAGASVFLTSGIALWTGWNYPGPEPLAALLGISVAIGNFFAVKRLGDRLVEVRTILMLAVLTVPSLIYSISVPQDFVDARLRQILALAVVAGVALWRLQRRRPLLWAIPGYLAGIGSMLALANLVHERVWTWFIGPELYSLPVLIAVLVGHAFLLPRINLKSSWIAWGIPMAIGVLPSAFDTAVVASTAFQDLNSMQIARVLLVLVASTGLLVFGVRLGNLANTAVGLSGLALLLVPNTALQSDRFLAGSQVESTALVIGGLVFVALAVAKRQGILQGRSTIFIGIPLAIIMGPALVRALLALANPSLTSVDWWRFGILLTAGLALLIVGALRELGGMFFPGLASVLMTALPYAFMQSKDQEWFLWVVLLIVATAMIWIALRLEKLRKLGRDSANWVRELK